MSDSLEICSHCDEPVDSATGICRGVLKSTFDRLADPDDWRGPIDATIEAEFRREVEAAVIFYTATVPTFEPAGTRGKVKLVRVRSEGYRMGPAGP